MFESLRSGDLLVLPVGKNADNARTLASYLVTRLFSSFALSMACPASGGM